MKPFLEVAETLVAYPVVLIVCRPAFADLVFLKRRTRKQEGLPTEFAMVVIPIRPPQEIPPAMKSYALQMVLPVKPPVIVHS